MSELAHAATGHVKGWFSLLEKVLCIHSFLHMREGGLPSNTLRQSLAQVPTHANILFAVTLTGFICIIRKLTGLMLEFLDNGNAEQKLDVGFDSSQQKVSGLQHGLRVKKKSIPAPVCQCSMTQALNGRSAHLPSQLGFRLKLQ